MQWTCEIPNHARALSFLEFSEQQKSLQILPADFNDHLGA